MVRILNILFCPLAVLAACVCFFKRKNTSSTPRLSKSKKRFTSTKFMFGNHELLSFSHPYKNTSIWYVSSIYSPLLRYLLHTLRCANYKHAIKSDDLYHTYENILMGFDVFGPKSQHHNLELCIDFALSIYFSKCYKCKTDTNDDFAEAVVANDWMRDCFREEKEIFPKIRAVIPNLVRLFMEKM